LRILKHVFHLPSVQTRGWRRIQRVDREVSEGSISVLLSDRHAAGEREQTKASKKLASNSSSALPSSLGRGAPRRSRADTTEGGASCDAHSIACSVADSRSEGKQLLRSEPRSSTARSPLQRLSLLRRCSSHQPPPASTKEQARLDDTISSLSIKNAPELTVTSAPSN